MEVKQIDAKDTYPLRKKILRPYHPIESVQFEGDDDEMSFHLGAFIGSELVSVASCYFSSHPAFSQSYQYQLRGMATDEQFQSQGLSKALLDMAFALVKRNNVDLLWCNARIEARGFYEKVGFHAIGEEFEIHDVGAHIVMSKVLAANTVEALRG